MYLKLTGWKQAPASIAIYMRRRLFPALLLRRFSSCTPSPSQQLTVFTSTTCTLCEPVKYIARRVAESIESCTYEEVDIHADSSGRWKDEYAFSIPVIHLNGEKVWAPTLEKNQISESELRSIVLSEGQNK